MVKIWLILFVSLCLSSPAYAIKTDMDGNGAIDIELGGTNGKTVSEAQANLNVEDGATNGATAAEAAAISSNTSKISYTDSAEVAANTSKIGITSQQATDITTNNAKISYTDSASVSANSAKVSYTDAATVSTAVQPGDDITTDSLTSTAPDGEHRVNAYNTTSPTTPCDASELGSEATSGSSGEEEYYCDGTDWILRSGGGGTDDQIAEEVPNTPSGNMASTDVQGAINELQTDVDGLQLTDTDLTAIAALSCSDDQIIKRVASAWACAADSTAAGAGWVATPWTYNDGTCTAGQYSASGLVGYLCIATDTVRTFTLADTLSATPVADNTPSGFGSVYLADTDVAISTLTTAGETYTVAGVDAGTAISITGGNYQIDAAGWTSAPGTVSNDDVIGVQQTSSGSNSTQTDAVVTIGTVSDTYSVTTVAGGASLVVDEGFETAGIPADGGGVTWASGGDSAPDFDYTTTVLAGSESVYQVGNNYSNFTVTFPAEAEIWVAFMFQGAIPSTLVEAFHIRDAVLAYTSLRITNGGEWALYPNGGSSEQGGTFAAATTYYVQLHYVTATNVTELYIASDAGQTWGSALLTVTGSGQGDTTSFKSYGNYDGLNKIVDDLKISTSQISW